MTYQTRFRVYWEDTDAGGIVYYANYLKYFERARSDWLRSLGIQQASFQQQGLGMFVVTNVEIAYKSPAQLDDEIIVDVKLLQIGAASLLMEQTASKKMTNSQGDDIISELVSAKVKAAWVNPVSRKPFKMPASLSSLLAPHQSNSSFTSHL